MSEEAAEKGAVTADQELWNDQRAVIVTLAVSVVVFRVLAEAVSAGARLPSDAYGEPVLEIEALTSPRFLFLALAPALVPFAFWRRLSWTNLDVLPGTRALILVIAIVLAWAFSTYDMNLFFDQWHVSSRILLIVLAGLIWLHPAFAGLFVVEATMVVSQFEYPLGLFSWTDKRLLFDAAVLFTTLLILQRWRSSIVRLFPLLLTTMLAAWMVAAGWGKLVLGWLWRDDLANLFVSAWSYGWLGQLGADSVDQIHDVLSVLNLPMKIGTAVVELGALVLLVRRRLIPVLLASFIALHLTIFLASGIFFWKWVVLEIALIWWYTRRDPAEPTDVAARRRKIIASVVLIVTGLVWARPAFLSWFDSNYVHRFELRAVGESGSTYRVDPGDVAPYDIVFAQNRFFFLARHEKLVDTYGTVYEAGLLRDLEDADGLEEVVEIEERAGERVDDASQSARFRRFVRRVFTELNEGQRKHAVPDWIRAPQHIWTAHGRESYARQERVTEVEIVEIRMLHRDGRVIDRAENVVGRIRIGSANDS